MIYTGMSVFMNFFKRLQLKKKNAMDSDFVPVLFCLLSRVPLVGKQPYKYVKKQCML